MQHGSSVLFLELTTTLSLLAFDPLSFSLGEHFLILNTQFATVNIHSVHGINYHPSVLSGLEVGESQTTENAIIEVIVEGIWLREVHVEHDRSKRLLSDGKGNVLDNNSSGDKLIGIGSV
jgi:hypothetical protein